MAIIQLNEILKLILHWEEKLDRFYSSRGRSLKNNSSRDTVRILQEEQKKLLKTLKAMDSREYKDTEFIKNPPEFSGAIEFPEHLSPWEVFEKVLNYQQQLLEYYSHLRDILVYKKDKELLETLSQLKLNQIKRMSSFVDNFSLVI